MKAKLTYKKELKFAEDLEVADEIKIAGLFCVVTNVEDVFHHMPKSRVRISLSISGATPRKSNAVLFLPAGTPVNILK